MKLLRRADAHGGPGTLEYRRSPERALAAYLVGWLGAGALGWWAWREEAWPLFYVAAFLGVVLFLLRGPLGARFGPANWLVRATPGGLYVHFRSHLNWHFPDEDATVVFVPYSEIRAAREVRESRTVAYRDAGHRSEREVLERRRFVELELEGDTAQLDAALAAERARKGPRIKHWYGSGSTTYRHYPVRLSAPDTLEIEWHVQPGAKQFLEQVGRFTRVEQAEKRSTDYSDLEHLDRAEQEKRLAALAATGQHMAAVAMARSLYGLDLKDAKDLIERLRASPGEEA